MSIHATAIVSPGAHIGQHVEIGAFSIVGPDVVLGDGCRLHHHVTIEGHTTLGEGCEVYPQAVLGTRPQDLKYAGEKTTLEIGRENIFREMVTVHPGTGNGGGVTRIGDHNLLLIGVHIAHDCYLADHCIIANYVQFAGHVRVEDHVNMGGHSAVHHFVTVGRHSFVGGMTRISADVPPFMVVVAARGTRSEVRMVNGVGLQRSGFSEEDIAALKAAYMKLFSRRARLSGSAIGDRVQELLMSGSVNPSVVYLCESLMRSFAHGRHGRYLEALRADAVHRNTWRPQTKFTLTVDVVGSGGVHQESMSDGEDGRDAMTLTATADKGWGFSGWNGCLSGRENPVRLTLDGHKTVIATFVKQSDK